MDKFLLGIILGISIERFHIVDVKSEGDMSDFLLLGLVLLAFGFMAWAIRALKV